MSHQTGRLGEGPVWVQLQGLEEMADHLQNLVAQSRYRLWIFSHTLHPALWAGAEVVEAVRRLALRHHRVQIRLLLTEPDQILRGTYPVITLAQSLTSRMEIRQAAAEEGQDPRSYVLADEEGFLLQPQWTRLDQGQVSYHDRMRVRRLAEHYQEAWDHGEAALGLRRLHI